MKYCKKCIMPDTKPHLVFDEYRVCSACQSSNRKKEILGGIDWGAREKEFEKLVLEAKAKNAHFYDVLVPVSGGKDSITQVHRLLKYGLRILAVNVDYGIKTEIGIQNLNCIPKMGVNLIIFRPDQELNIKLTRLGLEEYGDPDLMSHCLLHAFPLRVALQFGVPLVVLGENSAFEYGGDSVIANENYMTRKWFTKFAANNGNDPRVISEKYDIPYEKLKPYDFPDEIEHHPITLSAFMSYYFFWDSEEHLKIAEQYGFKSLEEAGEGTYRTYVGIDEKINRVHQYMKVLKFGYGRCTDHACEDIRNGYLTREKAKELIKKYDLEELSDKFSNDVASYLGYTKEEFMEIIESYRNKEIWKKDNNGRWFIPGHLYDN